MAAKNAALVLTFEKLKERDEKLEFLRDVLESSGYIPTIQEWKHDSLNHISKMICNASLVVLTANTSSPMLLYVLGIVHAFGKKSMVIAPQSIDFSILENILACDQTKAMHNGSFAEKLAQMLAGSEALNSPISMASISENDRPLKWVLSGEIRFNLSEIQKVKAKDLMFLGAWHDVSKTSFRILKCDTQAYDAIGVQKAIQELAPELRTKLADLYGMFKTINIKAISADLDPNPRTAQDYLKVIRQFELKCMMDARKTAKHLSAIGL